jgi:hypothetical protein
MTEQYLTAICFFHVNSGNLPLKYRNIKNESKFLDFIKGKGVIYVNWYKKNTKEFLKRTWINRQH